MSSSRDPVAWKPPLLEERDPGREEWLSPLVGERGGAARVLPDLMGSRESAEERTSEMEMRLAAAREQGRTEGLREGAARAEEKLTSAVLALQSVAESISASRRQHLQELDANLCALALAVAKRIVLREITTDPSIVRDWVRRALELVGPDAPIDVRLNPIDLELLEGELSQRSDGEEIPDIRWGADPELERGSFFVEGVHRIVDGRMDEALANLYVRIAHE